MSRQDTATNSASPLGSTSPTRARASLRPTTATVHASSSRKPSGSWRSGSTDRSQCELPESGHGDEMGTGPPPVPTPACSLHRCHPVVPRRPELEKCAVTVSRGTPHVWDVERRTGSEVPELTSGPCRCGQVWSHTGEDKMRWTSSGSSGRVNS